MEEEKLCMHCQKLFIISTKNRKASQNTFNTHQTFNCRSAPAALRTCDCGEIFPTRQYLKKHEKNCKSCVFPPGLASFTPRDHQDDASSLDSSSSLPSSLPSSSSSLIPPTRLSMALDHFTSASAQQAFLEAATDVYAPSTIKKHAWVLSLYKGFCNTFNYPDWPLCTSTSLANFIRFLGIEAHYAIGSIESVFIPSLKRIYKAEFSKSMPDEWYATLASSLHQLKLNPRMLKTSSEKEPLIYDDVLNIIRCTSDALFDKPLESALWLFAVSTGARSITCEHVTLGDIVGVHVASVTSMLVKIRLRVTKGNASDDHVVTLKGDPQVHSDSCFLSWLTLSLKLYHGLDLTEFSDWSDTIRALPLFGGLKRDSMRERLKVRALAAGYPAGRFGFHSLRSGFICTALCYANRFINRFKFQKSSISFYLIFIFHLFKFILI